MEKRRLFCFFQMLRRFRNGVKTARMERMALQNALCRQPSSSERAKAADRFDPVVRAGRVKAACRRFERGEKPLVKADERDHELGQPNTIPFRVSLSLA